MNSERTGFGGFTRALLLALLVTSLPVLSQEARFIDMTGEKPRTQLRYPPAPPTVCPEGGPCVGPGSGGGSVADGAPDRRDPHALALYVVSIQPTEIDPQQPVIAEFRLLNSGLASIQIPISPHLSDLQPASELREFDYESIGLALTERVPNKIGPAGSVELFGSRQRDDTLLKLKPGEWILAKGILTWHFPPTETHDAKLVPVFTLRTNTYSPHPGGSFTAARNIYPNVTPTPGVVVHFVVPAAK